MSATGSFDGVRASGISDKLTRATNLLIGGVNRLIGTMPVTYEAAGGKTIVQKDFNVATFSLGVEERYPVTGTTAPGAALRRREDSTKANE